MTNQFQQKKTTVRKKKRTKAQEEKRMKLLQRILDKWVYVKYSDGVDESYMFFKHRIQNGNSTSKIEQIVLSGDEFQDGMYLITDYEIDLEYDTRKKDHILNLKQKKFDKKIGMDAEEQLVSSYEELKSTLVGAKYLTEDEFALYCQSMKKPPGIEEIKLSFDAYDKK